MTLKPYYNHRGVRLYHGDCIDVLSQLPAESIQCCVTSPPYWGLRNYEVDGQIGLEKTVEGYVEKMVEVFREVRRVLRGDGTVWLNLGDSYASNNQKNPNTPSQEADNQQRAKKKGYHSPAFSITTGWNRNTMGVPLGLKPKDLIGIPWRVALALQADGWVLRQDIIWHKPNPMPESAKDRCTKAHEQLFLFAKAKWSGPPIARHSHISDGDARWLATVVDTEGCIVVKRVNHAGRNATYAPQVSIGGTHKPFIDKISAIVGEGSVLKRPGKNAPMWCWQLANVKAYALLYRIYPHLIIKPRQARIAMHVHSLTYYRGGKLPSRKMRSEAEEQMLRSLWERNKACNQFGDPDLVDVPEPCYGRWSGCEAYYYDAEAIKEGLAGKPHTPGNKKLDASRNDHDQMQEVWGADGTRNKRSVWTIPTQPFPGAHFAVMPEKLVEPCILAGTSQKGCCKKCGSPWKRVVEKDRQPTRPAVESKTYIEYPYQQDGAKSHSADVCGNRDPQRHCTTTKTVGWEPSCECAAGDPVPCTVLDMFSGSGTVSVVARNRRRRSIGIELSEEYLEMAKQRLGGDGHLETPDVKGDESDGSKLSLF